MKGKTRRKEKSPLKSNTKVTKNECQPTLKIQMNWVKFTIWEEKVLQKSF